MQGKELTPKDRTRKEIADGLKKTKQEETVSSFIQLMDEMEASDEENGEFFIKVGKRSDSPFEDSRALILKKGRSSTTKIPGLDIFDYVVITRKGPKIVIMTRDDFEAFFLRPLASLDTGSFVERDNDSFIILDRNEPSRRLTDCLEGDDEFVKQAMRQSLEAGRNRPALREEKRKQALAKALSGLLSPATQPSTDEGPATAPPS